MKAVTEGVSLQENANRQSLRLEKSEADRVRHHSMHALYEKEMSDSVTSRRFVIIVLLILISSIAAIYGAVSGMTDALQNDSNFIFLKLYTTSGNSVPSYVSFIALIGPFIGLMLGFDAINSERNNGTLNRLLAQPIYRDGVIIGKFLSGLTLVAVMIFASGIVIGAAGFLLIGIAPSGEELARVLVFLIYTVVYVGFWLAMAILFSVLCRHSATSALASIAMWVFFAIFMSLLAGIFANIKYPVNDQYQQMINALPNYNLNLALNRISPYYVYSEATSIILNPAARAINAVTYDQLVGAISGYLPMGQSLMLVWPHLFALTALTLAAFVLSYIKFMRQEIRSN